MSRSPVHRAAAGALALAVLAGCRDTPLPTAGLPGHSPPLIGSPSDQAIGPLEAQERLARRLALALGQAPQRAALHARLRQAQGEERKVHFQVLLESQGGLWRRALAAAGQGGETTLEADLRQVGPLEVYLPVPEHRASWAGGEEFLVATLLRDGEAPAAYDIAGRRHVLDPDRPPARPVLALVPAEQPFGASGDLISCGPECGGTTTTSVAPGLYLTYAGFTDTYESWLKGNPEFEVHVLGQDGDSSALTSYQCAGEHAGGPYAYDQNGKTWSGRVMLFSRAQLDAYQAAHPGQALRVLVIEDDDTACQIRTETGVLSTLFRTVDTAYQLWTGGREALTLTKAFEKARALQQAIAGIASLVKTNDDVVGTAIADAVVGQTWPGANWIVKGANNVTAGGIRLELR